MAIPTDPPFCLVYPTVYNDDTEDQNHFNTAASPSGMCTRSYICCTLLQHADKDPVCWITYEGSHLVIPHSPQYRTLFPEITAPSNHQGPLIDHNTGEPYSMATAGDFCLMDPIFPGSPGDSLLFKEDDLNRLKRKGFCVSTYTHCPQGGQTQVSLHQRECTKLLLQRGGISQQQQEHCSFITQGP